MGGMDDSDHNSQPALPAVVPLPVARTHKAEQRPARWHSGRLPDRLRRASRHPAVAGSLATAAGLVIRIGLRRILTSQRWPARSAGSAITPAPNVLADDRPLVSFRRTVVVETWTVRGRRD